MLSIEQIRNDPDRFRQALEARGESDPLAELLELDAQRRQTITEGDDLRAQRNLVNRSLGHARASGEEPSPDIIREMREAGEKVSQLEAQVRDLEEQINGILLGLPNLPLPQVPQGEDETANILVRNWGEPPSFDFTP